MSVTMLQCCNVKYVKLEDFEDEFKNINTISEYKKPLTQYVKSRVFIILACIIIN